MRRTLLPGDGEYVVVRRDEDRERCGAARAEVETVPGIGWIGRHEEELVPGDGETSRRHHRSRPGMHGALYGTIRGPVLGQGEGGLAVVTWPEGDDVDRLAVGGQDTTGRAPAVVADGGFALAVMVIRRRISAGC